jgi:hypothetical protein
MAFRRPTQQKLRESVGRGLDRVSYPGFPGIIPWFLMHYSLPQATSRCATTTNHSIFSHVWGQSKVKTMTINQKPHFNCVPRHLRHTGSIFSIDWWFDIMLKSSPWSSAAQSDVLLSDGLFAAHSLLNMRQLLSYVGLYEVGPLCVEFLRNKAETRVWHPGFLLIKNQGIKNG